MIQVRPLGEGHWLVSIEIALGRLTLLLSDTAALGNLYVWLYSALAQWLADDLLTVLARRVGSPTRP